MKLCMMFFHYFKIPCVFFQQQYVCIHKCIQCVVDGKEDNDNPYHGQVNEAYEGLRTLLSDCSLRTLANIEVSS